MHDVARDVSIFIASQERRVKVQRLHLDFFSPPPPPHEPFFPDLKLLFMNDKVEKEEEMKMNEHNLVGGSTKLNVLFIEYGLLKSLPLIINLTTLVLHHCESLESLADVAQMKNLEILICRRCYLIKELPEQVRGLKRLKLLEISDCPDLESVAAGVISSMVALEELEIVRSFKNWKGGETEDEGKEVACLREFESLKKLRCLDIHVSDIGLAAQPLCLLSPNLLVQFRVRFGNKLRRYDLPVEGYQRRMSLDFGAKNYIINLGDLSKNIFLTRAECLFACGDNQDFSLNLAAAQGIRWLTLKRFENKKNIASTTAAFPLLEYLSLDKMHKLEEIWDDDAPTPSNSFTNLKELRLVNLHSLKRMGKSALSTAKDFFLQLETIEIKKCKEMEHLLVLVPDEEQDEEDGITLSFPKLKTLRLCKLPKLRSICSSGGIKSIQFPLLAQMEIRGCNNLKCFVSRDGDDEDRHYRDGVHLFCHPKVTFGKLKILSCSGTVESNNVWTFWCDKVPMDFFRGLEHLKISNYEGIRRLFPSSKIPQNLVNLQKLFIEDCGKMVKVVGDEEEVSSSSSCDDPLFPSLQELQLCDLPKLGSFCPWTCACKLPLLKTLRIVHCLGMMSFEAVTPPLQNVRINNMSFQSIDDVNVEVREQYSRKAREYIYY